MTTTTYKVKVRNDINKILTQVAKQKNVDVDKYIESLVIGDILMRSINAGKRVRVTR